MKRYYLCDVIGDGTGDNPWRPAIDTIKGEEGEMRSFEVNVLTGQSIAVVDGREDHSKLIATSKVDVLPDVPMNLKLSEIQILTDNIEVKIANRGFSKEWNNSNSFRDMLRSVGKQINPNFDENNFGPQ